MALDSLNTTDQNGEASVLPPSEVADDADGDSRSVEEVTPGSIDSSMESPAASDAQLSDDAKDKKSKLDKMAREHPELASLLPEFLKKLAPWKGIMPESLRMELEKIEECAKEFEVAADKVRDENKSKEESKKPLFSCVVGKLTMDDWKQTIEHKINGQFPVVLAYYSSLHPSSFAETAPGATSAKQKGNKVSFSTEHRSLERIQIDSPLLCEEFESITATTLPGRPLLIPPPYKLPLHFLPDMNRRLQDLQEELAGMNTQPTDSYKLPTKDQNYGDLAENATAKSTNLSVQTGDSTTVETQNTARISRLSDRISHLKCLCDFVQEELKDLVQMQREIENKTLNMVDFRNLWHLFKPGDLVFSKERDNEQLYQVYAVTGASMQSRVRTLDEIRDIDRSEEREDGIEKMLRQEVFGIGSFTPLKIDCFSMTFDGQHLGPTQIVKKIKHYVGDRPITDLPVYPVGFHPDSAELLRRLKERGRKFVAAGGHKSYHGRTISTTRPTRIMPRPPPGYPGEQTQFLNSSPREEIHDEVYVDFHEFFGALPQYRPTLCQLRRSTPDPTEGSETVIFRGVRYRRPLSGNEIDIKLSSNFLADNRDRLESIKLEDALSDTTCLRLLPYEIYGYVFRLQQWRSMDVSYLRDIDRSPETRDRSFEDLVIADSLRQLLVGLILTHVSALERQTTKSETATATMANTQIDVVRGKGQGLVILLHGPPGSGKTSTAETIATYTQRPLYSITCGDLGTNPESVERRLRQHLQRAEKWGCVLLLDEADVFLMQRTHQHMERNALVSIFLRELEYYSGILFLTTNRPGILDEAFLSRIHLSLRYPVIDLESTKTIWSNIMNRIERDNEKASVKVVIKREELLEYAVSHFRRGQQHGRKTWNGRQIRNAFQTALSLGHSERLAKLQKKGLTPEQAAASGKSKLMQVKLSKKNMKKIVKATRNFEEYMQNLRGNDSDRARREDARDDHFDPDDPSMDIEYPQVGRPKRSEISGFMRSDLASGLPKKGKHKFVAITRSDDEEDDSSSSSEDGAPSGESGSE